MQSVDSISSNNIHDIYEVLSDTLEIKNIREKNILNISINNLGLDSIKLVSCIYHVESKFGVSLSFDDIYNCKNIGELADYILVKRSSDNAELDVDKKNSLNKPMISSLQKAYLIGRSGAYEFSSALHGYFEIKTNNLDIDRLERSCLNLLKKHPLLRSIISNSEYKLVDFEEIYKRFSIQKIDYKKESRINVREKLSHHIYDLSTWPFFELFVGQEGNYKIIHISFDGTFIDLKSTEILMNDLYQFYLDDVQVKEVNHLPYYPETLDCLQHNIVANLLTAPKLPTNPRNKYPKFSRFNRISFSYSKEITNSLDELATNFGTNIIIAVMSCFIDTLRMWSENEDFSLNIPVENRQSISLEEESVGNFSNFVLLQCFNEKGSFIDRLRKLRSNLYSLISNPYDGVSTLEAYKKISGYNNAMFPVVFTASEISTSDGLLNFFRNELDGKIEYGLTQTPQVTFDCQVHLIGRELHINWDHLEGFFSRDIVSSMAGYFDTLLKNLAKGRCAWETTKYLPNYQSSILIGKNKKIPNIHIVKHYEGVSEKKGNKSFIHDEEFDFSYAWVNEKSNKLAAIIKSITNSNFVVILLNNSVNVFVSVLACLKVGKAFVPIEKDTPIERINFIIEDSKTDTLLTTSNIIRNNKIRDEVENVIDIDNISGDYSRVHLDDFTKFKWGLEDSLYLLYTSGTTGNPKGVVVPYGAVCNLMNFSLESFSVTENSVIAGITRINHDLSIFDIFSCLMTGAQYVVLNKESILNTASMNKRLQKYGVTHWNSVPAILDVYVNYLDDMNIEFPKSLLTIILGGDWIPISLAEKIASIEGMNLTSIGGPTETTVWNTTYPIKKVKEGWSSIPYGKPIENCDYYILDDALRARPLGVAGELYASGDCLAKEYWNNQVLTSEKFIFHPIYKKRMFRTGDFGYINSEGNIVFLGRIDTTYKVNGVRVDSSEIDAELKSCHLVRRSVSLPFKTMGNSIAFCSFIQPLISYSSLDIEIQDDKERLKHKFSVDDSKLFNTTGLTIKSEEHLKSLKKVSDRKSIRHYSMCQKMYKKDFINLASCLIGFNRENHNNLNYTYPSAGSLYPVKTVIYIKPENSVDFDGGFYWVNQKLGQFEKISYPESINLFKLFSGVNIGVTTGSAGFIFLVADLKAIYPMYGKLSDQMCLLEAGYIGQMLMTSITTPNIGMCPLGFVREEYFQDMLSLDTSMKLMHTLAFGVVDDQKKPEDQNEKSHSESMKKFINDFLALKLPTQLIPKKYIFVDQLPMTNNGKIDAEKLISLMDDENHPVHNPPTNECEKKIHNIICNIAEIDTLNRDEDLIDMGVSSIDLIKLVSKINVEFDIDLSFKDIIFNSTIEKLAIEISECKIQSNESKIKILTSLYKVDDPSAHLFCIHPVGGSTLCYMGLDHKVIPNVNIYTIDSLLFESDVEVSLEEMAKEYSNIIRETVNSLENEKIILLGWSFGGVIAYEIANTMDIKNIDCYIIDPPTPGNSLSVSNVERCVRESIAHELGLYNRLATENYESMASFTGSVNQITDGQIDADTLIKMTEVMTKHSEMLNNHTPKKNIGLDVNLFKAENQNELLYQYYGEMCYMEYWEKLGIKSYKYLPGDHYAMPSLENLRVIINHIKESMTV